MKILHIVAYILLIIGGLNWLLVGAFDWNLVTTIFDEGSGLTRLVYVLVGLSAIVGLVTHKASCKNCDKGMQGGM